jgi:hypothetical protein
VTLQGAWLVSSVELSFVFCFRGACGRLMFAMRTKF